MQAPELWNLVGGFGSQLPGWVLTMTLWTGGLLGAAVVADRALQRHVAPRVRVLLYAGVLVRLALPIDWASPISLMPGGQDPVSVPSGSSDLLAPELPALIGVATQAAPSVSASSGVAPFGWGHVITLVYLAGVAAFLLWFSLARRNLRARIAEGTPARARLLRLSGGARVIEHPELGPLAFGTVRPVIVLPRALVDELSDSELSCVIAHERAHVERHDPLLASLLALVTAIAWPILPVWLTTARLRALIELAADERAIDDRSVAAYGRTLIKLADRPIPRPAIATGLHFGSFARLRRRVAALRPGRRWPVGVQIALVSGIGALAFACAGIDDLEDPADRATTCEVYKERATVLHDQSEKAGDARLRARADVAYEAYSDECAEDPDYAELLYYRAELTWAVASDMWQSGDEDTARVQFAKAHEQFRHALEAGSTRFTKDAAYGQMLAKRNELGIEMDADPALTKDPDPQFPRSEYSAEELELLASYDTYERHVTDPTDQGLQEVLAHRAKLAMAHNRFDEGRRIIHKLLDGSDGGEHHVHAAEMMTDLLTIDWVADDADPDEKRRATLALEAWLERVETMELYQHEKADKLRDAVPRLQAGLSWTRGMAERERGEDRACSETFAEIERRWPEHEHLDAVLLNAAKCQQGAGDRKAARDTVLRLARDFPDSPLLHEARVLGK